MKLIIIAALACAALSGCAPPQNDECVMQATGAGVTASADEALAAAGRVNAARASEVKTSAASATVRVK